MNAVATTDRVTPAQRGRIPSFDGHPLAGTRALVRLALRRDRVLIPVWLVVFVGMAGSTASSTLSLYPDIAGRREIGSTINSNPAAVALYGRILDIDAAGAVAMFKVNALGAALVAVLTLLLVTRHTRAEEEAGRLELLGAGVVGRFAPLTAALITSAGTAVVLGLLTGASLVAAGLPAAGSIAFGLAWALTGLSFAAVAAVTAQLTSAARAANGLAAAVLGLTYLLRAVGDLADESGPRWISWVSPVGWAQQVRPFAGERWWVFLPTLAVVGLIGFAAYVLVEQRDVGAGVLADRPGRPAASRWLSGPFGLALRRQRGTILAWTGVMLVLGCVVGSLGNSVEAFVQSDDLRDMIARLGGTDRIVDAFYSAELGAAALILSVFTIASVLRVRSEETSLLAEPILATPVGRRRYLASYLLVTALATAWLLLVVGLAMGTVAAVVLEDGARFGQLLGGALAQLPAVLVMAGAAAAVVGLLPRLAVAAWAILVGVLLLGELGPIFQLPQGVQDLSPFAHTPPPGAVTAGPLIALSAVAVLLAVVATEAFRRRDLD